MREAARLAGTSLILTRHHAVGTRRDSRLRVVRPSRVWSILRRAVCGGCAIALALSGSACSSSPQSRNPVDAAERLATELGAQLDRNGLAPTIARFQSVGQPWHAWNASSGRTSLQTLAGDEMDVSMSFWSGTLWTMVRAAPSGDGYCLLAASGSLFPDQPIAWWVTPSGVPKGKIADAAARAATAPN